MQKTFEGNYSPENYNDVYLGETTVRHAIELSQNIPFVEMLEEITPKTAIKYLEKMGISTLTDNDENLPLALGGLEKGITPLEMAAAYAMIANDGVYIEPTFYTTITNKSGKTVVKANPKTKKVVSKQVAYIMQEILTEPVEGNNGTARYCGISGIDVAAKTGTTNENYDRWLCGFTPYYTAVTWFGYDQNETIYFNKQNPAGIIWANVMKRIHSDLNDAAFEKPSWIQTATICANSGCIANSGCTNTYEEYFLWGTKPDECTKHSGTTVKNSTNSNNKSTNNNSTTKDTNTNELTLDPSLESEIPIQKNETNTTINNTLNTNNTSNMTDITDNDESSSDTNDTNIDINDDNSSNIGDTVNEPEDSQNNTSDVTQDTEENTSNTTETSIPTDSSNNSITNSE